MTDEPEVLRARAQELERALERERHTQFELRRQLLAADEAFNNLAGQLEALRAVRAHLSEVLGAPGGAPPHAVRSLLQDLHRILNGDRDHRPDAYSPGENSPTV